MDVVRTGVYSLRHRLKGTQDSHLNNHEISQFQKQLVSWYKNKSRHLPWRETIDPYCIWISEVMLQQTQVKTVLPYYRAFLLRFPDIFTLAAAELDDVLLLWEGLGYYARARNLHKAAGIIVESHDGIIPDDAEALQQLPGVGDYVASAILSIAYQRPFAAVDGNVKRVLARLFKINAFANEPASSGIYKKRAIRLLSKKLPGTHNQAMMELGALVCAPKDPSCLQCPVNGFCQAFLSCTIDQFPKKIKRPRIPQYHIATGVIFRGQKVLITRRKPEGLLGGLWEFPGGEVRKGETAEAACVRKIKEGVNLDIQVDNHITRIRHGYTHFKIVMDVFRCKWLGGRIRLNGPVDFRWIQLADTDAYAFPGSNHKFFPLLEGNIKVL